ncbi:MAG TPA: hypothetical protein PKC48_13755 [Sphingorhabdus sp.]|uniref:hypothetical protein n=1 Tax=Sphingorhabdus sp. TaxID=1902408 RepID=UPI002B7A12ED|nr:hypothetical protein [Sphingorhabdus sp.]HMT41153.1 hypothetical protein [Sphingorhabdus sp.]HMU23359.1 hypothetical protein [Sphingorhabdus sp.]
MTFQPRQALKMFVIVLPAILLLRYVAHEFGLISWVWQKPAWQTVAFAVLLSVALTAHRKSMT